MTKRPTWFVVVAVLAVLWNLFGLWSFYYHFTATPEVVATWPEVQQRIAEVTPSWIFVPFAIATVGGTLGSLGLLLGRRWATPVLLLSLLAIIVQFGAYYLLTPTWALTGMTGAALPLCIAVVGLLLWLLAGKAAARGWLR
jgi:hypothetical protein